MATSRRVGPLSVHEYGDPGGPVLVVLHGLTDSGQCWGDLVARLGSTYRIVAPDALGHGSSDRFTAEQLSSDDPLESMYSATATLLEQLAPDRGVLLMGHSMGGGMAAALSARRPDLVDALVLEDPVWMDGYWRGDPEEAIRRRIEDTRATTTDPASAIAQCRVEHPTWPESELAAWAQAKADCDEDLLRTGRSMLSTPWREIAAAIERPTLVVTGNDEVILDERLRAEIAALGNPSLEVRVVAGAQHCVRRDQGDAFHALVDPWLADR